MKPIALTHVGILGRESEVFLHRQIVGLRRYHACVTASEYRNRETFPCDDVRLLDGQSSISRAWLRIKHALTTGRRPGRNRVRMAEFRRLAQSVRPAVVHIHFLWNAIGYAAAAAECGVPVIVTGHGTDVNRARVDEAYRQQLQSVFASASKVVAVSDFIADKFAEVGCPPEKIVRCYLGAPIPRGLADVGTDGDTIEAVCVGSFKPVKGHRYLLKAMAKAMEIEPRLRLSLIGGGEQLPAMQALCEALGIADRVEFLGFLAPGEVQQRLQRSHLYLQHSVPVTVDTPGGKLMGEEGLGMSFVEAAGCGLPIVATRTGGVPEICRHDVNGLLIEPTDTAGMAEAIAHLAGDSALRTRYGQAGRTLVETEFDHAKQTAELERLYDSVRA